MRPRRIEFRAMGSAIHVWLAPSGGASGSGAAEALAALPDWFERWERRLSRFDRTSELSRLNRAAGRPVRVSRPLWKALVHALAAAEATGGLVTPTLANALVAAGYDRSFERMGEDRGRAAQPGFVASGHYMRGIVLDAGARTVCLPAGARVELGGTAKGLCADLAASRLRRWGAALVDAGGDIAVVGDAPGGWPIAIADPRRPESALALLRLPGGGVATSGRDYRRWRHEGRWQHHLIDPRTLRPAVTDVLTATVIAPSAALADVAAKVVLLLGSRAGLDWIEERPALAALVVRDDGRVVRSGRLDRHLWR